MHEGVLAQVMDARGLGRSVSTMAVSGTTRVCSATVTTMPSSTASVSGRLSVKVEPLPGREEIEMRPPSAWIERLTTSMPTPRPEMLETVAAVEKPGRKIRLSISLVGELRVRRRSGPCRWRSRARARG